VNALTTWFDEDVLDPAGALLKKVIATGDAELLSLATGVIAQIPATPSQDPVVVGIEKGIQSAVDVGITAEVGGLPVIGQPLAAEAVTVVNKGIAYLEGIGAPFFDKLAASLKSTLSKLV